MLERIVRITIGPNLRIIGLLATAKLEFMDLDRDFTHLWDLFDTPNQQQHEAKNIRNKFEDILRYFSRVYLIFCILNFLSKYYFEFTVAKVTITKTAFLIVTFAVQTI